MSDMSRVASMNPENMIAGGLADDFDGTIKKVRLVPWDYNGKFDEHVLAVAVTIQPDTDQGDEFVQHYSAGNLTDFQPSADGENPVDLSNPEANHEGVFAIKVGKKDGLNNNTNWAQFISAALEAGLPKERLSANVATMFEGVKGHFNRIGQKKRSGLVKADDKANKKSEILVITEYKGAEGKKGIVVGSSKPSSTTSSESTPSATTAPATSSASSNGLDGKLVEIVREAVKAEAEGLSKTKLPAIALKKLAAADKGKGVKRIVEAEFLNGHEEFWAFDAESGTLISVE